MKTMECEPSFQQKSLFQQGYTTYTPNELRQLEWGLRFTPTVCSSITVIGLIYQLPYLLFAVAGLGFWAFFFPGGHPMDLIYNKGVRHLFGAVQLPPNPLQRRLACLSAGIMNFAIGFLFLGGFIIAGWIVGGVLLILQGIVIATHFCTLSWMYEGILRLMGRWKLPIPLEQARRLLDRGAVVIDVRGPDEFARGHVKDAMNLPLEEIENQLELIKSRPSLLYCSGGLRSQIAVEKLRKRGLTETYDLGGMDRVKRILN